MSTHWADGPTLLVVWAPIGAVVGGVGGGIAGATHGSGPRQLNTKERLERHHQSAVELRERVIARTEAGNAEDMQHLAAMYEHSFTVRNPSDSDPYWITIIPQDYVQAYKWRTLAGICGSSDQMSRRDRLAKDMSPEQIAEAEGLITEWRSGGKSCAASTGEGGAGVFSSPEHGDLSSTGRGASERLKRLHSLAIEHREQTMQKAEAGDAEAMANLATMYEHSLTIGMPSGSGQSWTTIIPKDYVQAYKWRTLADFCGSSNQITLRIKLSARMSGREVAEAERLVSEWHSEGGGCGIDANDVASSMK